MMKRKGLGKRITALLAAAVIAFGGITPVEAKAHPFKDVTAGDWFNNDVERAFNSGLVNGKDAVTFDPYGNLTAAETVKLAVAMNQKTLDGSVTIVNGNPWYSTWVAAAKEKGIISRDYNWNTPISRADYLAIFAKALPDSYLQGINDVPDGSVPDVASNHQEAAAIYKMYRAGIVEGNDTVTRVFLPNNMITRGEVSAITTRMMDASMRKRFVMTGGSSTGTATGTNITPDTPLTPSAPETPSSPDTSETPGTPGTSDSDDEKPSETTDPLKETGMKEVSSAAVSGLIVKHMAGNYNQKTADSEAIMAVKVTGGTPPYKYQWCKAFEKVTGGGRRNDLDHYNPEIKGATSDTYKTTAPGIYYCIVTDSTSPEPLVAEPSSEEMIKVTNTAITETLKVVTQPANVTVAESGKATFKVEAAGGKAPLSYSWEFYHFQGGGYIANNSDFSGATTNQLTINNVKGKDGYTFICRVKDANGETISSTAKLNVVKPLEFTEYTYNASSTAATIKVNVKGGLEPYKYKWQYRYREWSDSEWVDLENKTHKIVGTGYIGPFEGVKTATLTVKGNFSTGLSGDFYYRCIITDSFGSGQQVISTEKNEFQ